MQDVSYKFRRLFADITSNVEIRATINGVVYSKSELYGASVSQNLLTNNKPSVGGTVSNTFSVTIMPQAGVDIPRGATVSLECRIVTADEESEWIPKGTFYIDNRETTSDGLQTTLYCFDAFLKAEQTYPNVGTETWPKTESTVVSTILTLMGIELDSRTTLKNYNVEYPGDLTCREILGYIAAANGGNWTITDENKLRLVSLFPDFSILAKDSSTGILFGDTLITVFGAARMGLLADENERAIVFGDKTVSIGEVPDGLDIKRNAEEYRKDGSLAAISRVTVWWTDEDAFTAGTDDGQTLELDCPWATQAMANDLLDRFGGLVYRAYDVTKAQVTPSAEMGDVVVIDGHPMPLLSLKVSYDGSYFPDIAAPPDDEVDSEYPYETQTQKQLARRVKLGNKYYGVAISREHGIEITKTDGNNTYSRATLNSDVLAFYDDNGTQRIYFDSNLGKYCFNGDVTITSGSIDINNGQFSVTTAGVVSINSGMFEIGGTALAPNFQVDLQGNLTTNGNVTMQGNTLLSAPKIVSPDIRANAFSVFPTNMDDEDYPSSIPNGFNLYGYQSGALAPYHYLNIAPVDNSIPPYTVISTPQDNDAYILFDNDVLFGSKAYYGGLSSNDEVATKGDIPSLSGYATEGWVIAYVQSVLPTE